MPPQTDLKQGWGRLRTAVRGMAAVIAGEPEYLVSIKASADRALELLADAPSVEAADEIAYLLGRKDEFIAKWRPSPDPEPGSFYIQLGWASSTDPENQALGQFACSPAPATVGASSKPTISSSSHA
jgi:hypothetical protein